MSAPLKVINLGLPKSGTTTLSEALRQAGLNVADWKVSKQQAEIRGFVGHLMYTAYFDSGDPLALMPTFDAFTENSIIRNSLNLWPQMDWGIIEAIRKHNPGAKFLLSHRDPVLLSQSMMGWSNLGKYRLPTNDIPGLPEGFGDTEEHQARWIEAHYSFCRQVFRGAGDFLEYDVTDPDAPKQISAFLGIELPWWGRVNKGQLKPNEGKRRARFKKKAEIEIAKDAE